MKFFFPDSQDQINPNFDLEREQHAVHHVRQRDDRYAHEILRRPAYDGVLVSKATVDGTRISSGRYTFAHRQRLYRLGVHRFFRLQGSGRPPLLAMGDCGAFTYVNEEEPPYTVDEVIDFYEGCGFDYGFSLDHVILGYHPGEDQLFDSAPPEWTRRRKLTLELAREFLRRHRARRARFKPIGVAQGWNPRSFAKSVSELQKMGYERVALGGMVALKTPDILDCLAAVADVRERNTGIHLLGVTRCEHVGRFRKYGVTSFDSTSPFRQAFKDERDNYYTLADTYVALRVPPVERNASLKRRIQAGQIDQASAIEAERRCLETLTRFDAGRATVNSVLTALRRYQEIYDPGRDRTAAYRRTLETQPWRTCHCGICDKIGIQVAIFRGSERNKRRGFHNLSVFRTRLERELGQSQGKRLPRRTTKPSPAKARR